MDLFYVLKHDHEDKILCQSTYRNLIVINLINGKNCRQWEIRLKNV